MSLTDRRTQLYMSEEQYRKIMKLAKDKRKTFAQLTREALDDLLRKNENRWENDPITQHIGIIKNKDKDLSNNHDHYIYDFDE